MADLNLGGGTLTAGNLVAPGFAGPPAARTNERIGTPAAAASTLTMTLNTAYATPIYIADAATLIEIAVKVTTAIATGLVRLGIYHDDGALNPSTVLLDAGTIDASTTGIKPLTISQAVTPGNWWLVAVAQTAAPGVSSISGGLTQLPSSGSDNFASTTTGYTQAGVTGAFATWAGTRVVASSCSRVFVRHA